MGKQRRFRVPCLRTRKHVAPSQGLRTCLRVRKHGTQSSYPVHLVSPAIVHTPYLVSLLSWSSIVIIENESDADPSIAPEEFSDEGGEHAGIGWCISGMENR